MKSTLLTSARLRRSHILLAGTLLAAVNSAHAQDQDGTWIANASSTWTTAANWQDNQIANGAGFTANFTAELTALITVTLDGDRTIGNIVFTDGETSSHNLIIAGDILTLDAANPAIDVTQSDRILRIDSVLAGTNGFTKSGPGLLALTGTNTCSGATNIDNGILRLDNLSSLGTTSAINLGSTTGTQLLMNVDSATLAAPITVADTGITSTLAFTTLGDTTNLNSAIGGNGNLLFLYSGGGDNSPTTINLNQASNYAGATTLDAAVVGGNILLVSGIENALPATTGLDFAGTAGTGTGRRQNFDLNGNSQTLAGLSSTAANLRLQRVQNTSGDAATLTIDNDSDHVFRGMLGSNAVGGGFNLTTGNNFSVVKDGPGTWALAIQTTSAATNSLPARNSYAGGTTVNAGALCFLNPATIPATGTHTFAAGTTLGLGVSGASAFSATDIDNAFSNNMTGNLAGIVIDATTRIGLDTTLGNATFSGDITGSPARDLVKLGAGILTLSGTNTYTGATHINSGSIIASNLGAFNGTSAINLGTTTGTQLRFNVDNMTVSATINTANAGQTSTLTSRTDLGSGGIPTTNLGRITGAGNVRFNNEWIGSGNLRHTFNLNAASDYAGNTTIDSINTQNTYLVPGVADALPPTTVLTFADTAGDGTGRQMNLDLNGLNQTLGGLAATGSANVRVWRVHNTSATAATLTINDDGNRTFRGILGSTGVGGGINLNSGNNFSVVKNGTGTWTLSAHRVSTATNSADAPNSYTGSTTINAGAIALGNGASIASSASLTLGAAGTFDTTAQATYTIPASQPVAFTLDPAGSGTSGKIAADGLDITNAQVSYNALGALDDSVYILATYSTLSGEEFDPFPAAPFGYTLDYAYQGNKIALVSDAAGGFASWQSVNGATGGFADDHDSDGAPNGIEFFLGGPNGNTTGFTELPGIDGETMSITWNKGTGYDGDYGTDFWVETSEDLGATPWTKQTLPMGNVSDDTGFVKFTFPSPLGTRLFTRLVVTGP
jgi:autotransporter-associated beta strand protein